MFKCCLTRRDKALVQFLSVTTFHSVFVETVTEPCVCVFAVLGTIRSAVGSAQLLISQKFEQFRGLCNENLVSGSVTHVLLNPSSYLPVYRWLASFLHWLHFHPTSVPSPFVWLLCAVLGQSRPRQTCVWNALETSERRDSSHRHTERSSRGRNRM